MEALLSLLVVIIMIFAKSSKNGKGNGKKPQPQRYPAQSQQWSPQPQKYAAQSQQWSPQPQRYPAQSQPQRYAAQSQQRKYPAQASQTGNQAELKRRLQEKYGVVQTQGKAPETLHETAERSEDILYRAAETVAEYDKVDELEQTDYMSQIQDLMIMGFTQELPNQRDFVAEGIEMLNRFELPATELPETDFELSGI